MLAAGVSLQGRYIVECVLGRGGMGAVYLARQTLLGKKVAIKELALDVSDPEVRRAALQQFHREAEILGQLCHPNLVRVIDFFEEGETYYLVMDYVAGQTLDLLVRSAEKPLPMEQVLPWVEQVCDVLEYCHGQASPIILRDLKPGNIMLTQQGHCYVIDFGIARRMEQGSTTATFIKGAGTEGFAPLEQYAGSTDNRSDIYALGATVYTLLTLDRPPASVEIAGGMAIKPASAINPTVTPAVDAVIFRMLALTQRERYQTVGEAREALRAATAGRPVPMAVHNRLVSCPQCGQPVRDGKACARCGSAAKPLLPKPAPATAVTVRPVVKDDATEVMNRPPQVLQTQTAPTRRSPALPLAIAALVVICLGLTWRALAPKPSGVATAPPRPTPSPVTVALAVSPASAQVALDGTVVDAKSWAHLKVAPGEHVLQVHCDGYDPVSKTVTAASGASWKVHMVVLPARLTIDSYPVGAKVLVDGKPRGEAPLTLTVTPATHSVQASLDGYQSAAQNVQVNAGATKEVALSLQRIAQAQPAQPQQQVIVLPAPAPYPTYQAPPPSMYGRPPVRPYVPPTYRAVTPQPAPSRGVPSGVVVGGNPQMNRSGPSIPITAPWQQPHF